MPREYQWNLTVQRQLTPSMIAEAAYSGNHSSTLLVSDNTNPFPGQDLNPALAPLLSTQVQNPVAGQLMSNATDYTSATVPLGALLNSNPSRGNLVVEGMNEGSSITLSASSWTTSAAPARASGEMAYSKSPGSPRIPSVTPTATILTTGPIA